MFLMFFFNLQINDFLSVGCQASDGKVAGSTAR